MHHRSQFTTSRFGNPTNHVNEGSPAHPSRSVPRYTGADSPESSISMRHNDNHSDQYAGEYADYGYESDYEYRDHDYAYAQTSYFTAPGSASQDRMTAEPAPATRRSGAHRLPTPPTALKGRAAVLAVAAGAVVAAGQAGLSNSSSDSSQTEVALASDNESTVGTTAEPQAAQFSTLSDTTSAAASQSDAPQVLNVANPTDLSQFNNLLAKGQRFSEERAAREAAARRPLFVLPAIGSFTSSFGSRWGTLHAGVDIAAPIGTPIVAVADGKVIDSGPASGFGMWVRLLHADGTITVYGHINESIVSVGQEVMAGDQIATIGNRGFSTGPHLHFEVHLPGENKIDPIPWLASRGISLGIEQD